MSDLLRNPVENGLIGGLGLKLSRVIWSRVHTRLTIFCLSSGILQLCMRQLITCSVLVSRGGGGGWHRVVQKRWIPDMVVLV